VLEVDDPLGQLILFEVLVRKNAVAQAGVPPNPDQLPSKNYVALLCVVHCSGRLRSRVE